MTYDGVEVGRGGEKRRKSRWGFVSVGWLVARLCAAIWSARRAAYGAGLIGSGVPEPGEPRPACPSAGWTSSPDSAKGKLSTPPCSRSHTSTVETQHPSDPICRLISRTLARSELALVGLGGRGVVDISDLRPA